MKPIRTCSLLACILAITCAAPTQAAILVEELFDYTASSGLGGKNGGTGFASGSSWSAGSASGGTGGFTITADGAAATNSTKGSWALRSLAPIESVNYSSIYLAWDMVVSSYGTKSSGFDCIEFSGIQAGGSSQVLAFSIGLGFESWGYKVQIDNKTVQNNIRVGPSWMTTADILVHLVAKLDFDIDGKSVITLWLNPDDEGAAPVYTANLGYSLTSLTRLNLIRYHDNSTTPTRTTELDNLRIGTDWASAHGMAIPEPETWAGIVGGSFLVFACLHRWRRRH